MISSVMLAFDRLTSLAKISSMFRFVGPIGVIACGLLTFWQVPEGPQVNEDSPKAQRVRSVAEQVVEQLPSSPTEKRVLVLPFEHDTSMRVTHSLRQILNADAGQYLGVGDDVVQRMANKWRHLLNQNPSVVPMQDSQLAASRARRAGADYALTGAVQQVTADNVEFEVALIDAGSQQEVFRKQFSSPAESEEAPQQNVTSSNSIRAREYLLGIAAVAFLLPLALTGFIKRVLKTENNGLTLATMLTIAAVPIAMAYPWAMLNEPSVWLTGAFAVASLLNILWCLFVASQVANSVEY